MRTFTDDSGITDLCSLSQSTFLSLNGEQRSVKMWDVRQSERDSTVKVFQDMHNDRVNALERLNQEVFCSTSNDGTVNIWNLKMNKLMKNVPVCTSSRVTAVKFLKQRYMLVAHENKLTLMDVINDFKYIDTYTPNCEDYSSAYSSDSAKGIGHG